MKWNAPASPLHLGAADYVSAIAVPDDACGSLILEMDCAFAVISNEWETGCSQSKASTDSDALTPAPQITQHCYLPEDTISETHQKFCLWSRSAHMHASDMGLHHAHSTHSSDRSLIAREYSIAWLIMKEQLGLSGFGPKATLLPSASCRRTTLVRLTPTVGPQGWSTGFLPTWMSEPSLPPVLSSISAACVQRNPHASISGVAMCDVDWDVFPRLGPDPEPACVSLLIGAFIMCERLPARRMIFILMSRVIPWW